MLTAVKRGALALIVGLAIWGAFAKRGDVFSTGGEVLAGFVAGSVVFGSMYGFDEMDRRAPRRPEFMDGDDDDGEQA
jgi:hypothetical protein